MKEEPRDEVVRNFGNYYWHDSRIVNLRITKGDNGKSYSLELDVDLYEKNLSGELEQERRVVGFSDCRIIQVDVDLLGILFCNGDIANATCTKEVFDLEASRRGKLKDFDFPDSVHPFKSCLGFLFEMIHPGGEILIFAKSFEVR